MKAPGPKHSTLCILQKQDVLWAVIRWFQSVVFSMPSLLLMLLTTSQLKSKKVKEVLKRLPNSYIIRQCCRRTRCVYISLRSHSLALQIEEFTLWRTARGTLSESSSPSHILSEPSCDDNPPIKSHDFRRVALISRLSNRCCHVTVLLCSVQ